MEIGQLGKAQQAMPRALLWLLLSTAAWGCGDSVAVDAESKPASSPASSSALLPIDDFFELFNPDPDIRRDTIDSIFRGWHPAYASIVIEAARFSEHREELLDRLSRAVGVDFERDFDRSYRWLWNRPAVLHPEYATFKAILYRQIDPRFASYFESASETDARVRLDEVRWGGVRRDGIPPLDHPAMLPAADADYLEDENIVFGVEVGGEARAYPQRILAWHEMVRDVVGGVSVHGVYCTLCGTMILYRSEFDGEQHVLGTSGFLYRSNKLMFDRETESLWSTIHGEPVLGPLANAGIRLEPLSVVTTTWGRWLALHPDTRVLSLATGYTRDYSEGAAYREYFATDELMFSVPFEDRRLRNKDEVLALRFGGSDAPPTAIAAAFLQATPVYHGRLGKRGFVVLTDPSGANRVYAAEAEEKFSSYDGGRAIVDNRGRRWQVQEDGLVGVGGERRQRLSAHRAFWFGWHAAHPDTELVTGPRS